MSACSTIVKDINKPDIKEINTSKGIAFDIRIIKDLYGIPPIVDINKNTIGYYNVYCEYDGFLFFIEPKSSQIWYLLMQPTKDDNYYVGTRYVATFPATEGKNPTFTHGDPKIKISDIIKYENISNDPFKEKHDLEAKRAKANEAKKPNTSNLKLNTKPKN